MYKIGISAWTGMTVRNILFGNTLVELKREFQVTVISYYGDQLKTALPLEAQGNLKFEKLQNPRWNLPHLRGRLQPILDRWGLYALWSRKRVPILWLYFLRKEWESAPTRAIVTRWGSGLAVKHRENIARDFLRDIAYSVPIKRQFRDLDALFVASINTAKDRQIIYSCRKYGIPVIALVHSWDNLTSKGWLPALPDRLLVWNKFMAHEAQLLHNVPEKTIDIVGGPQYELYREMAQRVKRSKFLNRFDLSPERKIITYTGCAEWLYPDEECLIDHLLEKISKGDFGKSTLIFRLHPTEARSARYQERFRDPSLPIRLVLPDSGFAAQNSWRVGSSDSIQAFVETMAFSDVVINMSSTIVVDAICFDTPVICTKFNFSHDKNSWNAAHNNFLTDHFKPIVESNAVYLPQSPKELNLAIQDALENPTGMSQARKALAREIIPDLPTSALIRENIVQVCEEVRHS